MAVKPTRKRTQGRDVVEQYALNVLNDVVVAGPWVRLACKRHLRDLEEQEQRGIVWDFAQAELIFGFFTNCLCHGDGQFDGLKFTLLPWQEFILGNLHGWRWHRDGSRRFRTAYIEAGKGCGKSPIVAGLTLYELLMGPRGAEIFSAATGRDQAKIVFKRAELMVSKSPAVRKRLKVTKESISFQGSMSSFRPVSREAGSLEGHNVHLAVIDEVHMHKNSDVCDTMQDGTKGRPNAQVIEITNTGAGSHNICFDHHRYSESILEGLIENDAWFTYMCALDKTDDWRDKKVWVKANPSIGVTVSYDFLEEQVNKASGMPARERRIQRLNFCMWDDAGPDRAIEPEVWRACGAPIDLSQWEGQVCYGGLDLASVADLTAFVLVCRLPDRTVQVKPWFWLPDEGLEAKERRDKVPYRMWRDQGFLETTPGPTVDNWFVARRIEQICGQYDVEKIAYDRWGMEAFKGTMRAIEVDLPEDRFEPFGQGFASMGPAIDELERLMLAKLLQHGSHPILDMCAAFAVAAKDPAGNRKWSKDKVEQRIDGIVALTMAVGMLNNYQMLKVEKPSYQIMVFGAPR